MRKVCNYILSISFILTILVCVTGVQIHKFAGTLFLLLCIFHTFQHRNKLNTKRYLLLMLILLCFMSGLFGMVFDAHPFLLILHKVLSLILIGFISIHVYVYHKKFKNLCLK